MASLTVHPAARLRGTLTVPGDKSISHRALMLGAIAQGPTTITGCLDAEDCRATQAAFATMGVPIDWRGDQVRIKGRGLHGLSAPSGPIDCGNSGTTMRLLLGILAGQSFPVTLTGDASLVKRPMARVTHLLRRMGARIDGRKDANFAPLTVRGGSLTSFDHQMTVPSAQVKSALLLAGLYATTGGGMTRIVESVLTRDHTERMLAAMGAAISIIGDLKNGRMITVRGGQELTGRELQIPGDFSSAAFWWVAAAIVPGSEVTVHGVGLNPTRTGLLEVLRTMGADVTVEEAPGQAWEPQGTVTVRGSRLRGTTIEGPLLPRLIDEIPILMVAAAAAEGRTVIRDAAELRVKETDRIHSMVSNLQAVGARIAVEGHTIVIEGPTKFRAATVPSFGDHRTAMALAIAGLAADGPVTIEDTACIRTSYPGFADALRTLTKS